MAGDVPPLIPSGGNIDGSYGSCYSISGDGETVVGLYWRAGNGNRAHASGWRQSTGPDLGGMLTGQAGRANGVNYNGTVIGGWVETPQGPWRPAAWSNGSLEPLTDWQMNGIAGSGEVKAVSPDGNIAVGYCINSDDLFRQRAAAMWKRVNGVWRPDAVPRLGARLGAPIRHQRRNCVQRDGRIAAGYASTDGRRSPRRRSCGRPPRASRRSTSGSPTMACSWTRTPHRGPPGDDAGRTADLRQRQDADAAVHHQVLPASRYQHAGRVGAPLQPRLSAERGSAGT